MVSCIPVFFSFFQRPTKPVFGIFKIHVTTTSSAEASNCSFKKNAVERVYMWGGGNPLGYQTLTNLSRVDPLWSSQNNTNMW